MMHSNGEKSRGVSMLRIGYWTQDSTVSVSYQFNSLAPERS